MAMATPIRKKRNFKALQLNVAEPAPATAKEAEPVAIRQAPAPAASAPVERKKRPPPMIIKAPKIPNSSGAVSAVEQDGNLLTVSSTANTAPHSASPAIRRNTYHATLSSTLANLDMNAEIKFDLKDGDLKDLQELGQGNGGSVKKVEHVPTKTIMAKKVRPQFLFVFQLDLTVAYSKRLSSSMLNHLYGSKFYASFKSCMTAIPSTSSRFGGLSSQIPTFVCALSLWIKVLWMASTRRLDQLISTWLGKWRWRCWKV